ncbi:hypothetical protein [Solimonas marina]|uniref:Uncharacterized protein n=1 Tax=Solimonas marina TaxID=2714601 RepID=A0A970B5H5_9GAMM|nr:hypothetical protein [Solimonas marina]NKF21575.1 hypothetical protein [Solimonas marina]
MNTKNFAALLCSPDGIALPASTLAVGGYVGLARNDEPMEWSHNLVSNEGLADLLSVYLAGGTPATAWYVAPWANNVTPGAAWTAANFDATAGEFTGYDEANRPVWTPGEVADQTISSILNAATFTINTAGTIYGAALVSAQAKQATTGKLFSAFRFANSRTFEAGDTMSIAYFVQAQSNA